MYRGQSQMWPLLPSITRLSAILNSYENWRVLQEDLLDLRENLGYSRPRRRLQDVLLIGLYLITKNLGLCSKSIAASNRSMRQGHDNRIIYEQI